MYKYLLKPLLFRFSPEKAHWLTIIMFRFVLFVPGVKLLFNYFLNVKHKSLKRTVWGLKFNNPVGLAAGFDKDGKYYDIMSNLGFGFIEIGTVTPKGQEGNPLPRLFRLPNDKALINRMGFNNDGVDALVERLKTRKDFKTIIGGNIGKNKNTPNENALSDYVYCFEKLYNYVDYFVVNVSSPNTPGLRELQDKKPLTEILSTLKSISLGKKIKKPILLKIAPDLTETQLDDIVEIILDTNTDGIIATNTTIERKGLKQNTDNIGNGGLSGQPVKDRSTEVIRYIFEKSKGKFPIIGVGGISNATDAIEKLEAGATLVQVYTGLVYEGPTMVKNINTGILRDLLK